MVTGRFNLGVPKPFSFWRTVYSHGWCTLPPFYVDKDGERLERILRLGDGTLVHCILRDAKSGIVVTTRSHGPLTPSHRKEIISQLRTSLRLDEDLSAFIAAAKKHPRFKWVVSSGCGRLLRAPTVFEDVVKTMCTTNCAWALTEVMVKNLTRHLGEPLDGGLHSFPKPETMASVTEKFMRKNIRSGYRSPYLIEFADRVASGALDVESWRTSPRPTEELFREVKGIKGIGEYAAGSLLRLFGRYDYLALDSWVRGKYSELHHRGRAISDKTIERAYKPYGKWRGLFFWFEMTEHWLNQKFPF